MEQHRRVLCRHDTAPDPPSRSSLTRTTREGCTVRGHGIALHHCRRDRQDRRQNCSGWSQAGWTGDGPTGYGTRILSVAASACIARDRSKSLSHEITFEHDTHDRPFLERTLRGFLRDLARDLRQEGLAAESCTVKLKNARFVITTKQHRFPHPLNYDPDIWPTVQQALQELVRPGTEYRLAGLALSSLTPAPPGLFDQRRTKAIETMDALIAKHGSSVIGLGGVSHDDTE